MNANVIRNILFVLIALFVLAFATPAFAQESPEAPVTFQVTAESGLRVRQLPNIEALYTAPVMPQGTQFFVYEVVEDAGYVWGRHDLGWSAVSFNGTILATEVEGDSAIAPQAQALRAPSVPMLNQKPLRTSEGQVIGFANTPQVSPAVISIPEGGFAVWAQEVNSGVWMLETYMGNPDDNSPTDLNYTVEKEFTGNSMWIFVYDKAVDMTQITLLFAQELLSTGLAESVMIDEQTYVEGTTTAVLGLIEETTFSALQNSSFVPYGANSWEDDNGSAWQFIAPTSQSVVLPIGDGQFSYSSFGKGTAEVNKEWSRSFSADIVDDAGIVQSYGTVMNLLVFVDEVGDSTVQFSDHVAGNLSFVTKTSGKETLQQAVEGNAKNGFFAPNCGRGCLRVDVTVIVTTKAGTFSATESFEVPDGFHRMTSEDQEKILNNLITQGTIGLLISDAKLVGGL